MGGRRKDITGGWEKRERGGKLFQGTFSSERSLAGVPPPKVIMCLLRGSKLPHVVQPRHFYFLSRAVYSTRSPFTKGKNSFYGEISRHAPHTQTSDSIPLQVVIGPLRRSRLPPSF